MLGRMDSKGERLERKGDVGMGRMKRPFWPGGGGGVLEVIQQTSETAAASGVDNVGA
jgi:hypothetical protein